MTQNKILRRLFIGLYYGFARYLPPTHKNIVGKFGGLLRLYCARHLFKSCAPDANIEHMAYFGTGCAIEIGSRSGIGIHCTVPNNIKIGDNVMMGPHCRFMHNVTHRFDSVDTPMIEQGLITIAKPIIIGDDVWFGRECFMLGGKQIGSHTVIGARSVISKDIPEYVVAAGNPIRVIRSRK